MAAVRPNFFQLHGKHLHVSYALTGIDGRPHLAYQDTHHSVQFTGDEIRNVTTEIGTIVTVNIQSTPDLGSTTFSLLVPTVNLDQTQKSAHISTEVSYF